MTKPLRKKRKNPKPIQKKPDQLEVALAHAIDSGNYMVAVFSMNGNRVELFKRCVNFPTNNLDTAVDLLETNVRQQQASKKKAE